METQFANITAQQVLKLRSQVDKLMQATQGKFRFATGCSGTDMIAFALEAVFGRFKALFGLSAELTHCFSCENVPFKQQWIEDHCQPYCIFWRVPP